MASTEAKPEGTHSWRLSANYSLLLTGKLSLVGIQSGAPPWLPVHSQEHSNFEGVVS